ncbi:MAG: DUF4214 domain-containing protein, partial [Pyrinomonadaceae bacterium]
MKPRPPEKGAPGLALPNLDEVRHAAPVSPEARPPISSSVRSKRKPIELLKKQTAPGSARPQAYAAPVRTRRDGRQVAASGVQMREKQARSMHHAKRKGNSAISSPPLLADDQYVQHFLSAAIPGYQASELTYWTNILRAAEAQGLDALLMATREMGRTIFESAAYAARNRTDHEYVYDLYQTYLMRDPDIGGWAFWEGCIPPNGRLGVREGFLVASTEFHDLVATLTAGGAISGVVSSITNARVDPFNQTGDQLAARDCEWSLPLISLPGRAGLDLGLGLSYSSLVWTRSGPYLYFDEDHSPISPGFRLGFASIQGPFFEAQFRKKIYLLISSSGRRVELRQLGASNVFEAGDSSYLQLSDNGTSLLLRSTDGTQLSYEPTANGWQATLVKDRNGNYLSIVNNDYGDIQTVVDTAGRVFYFNYDSSANLNSITQYWNGGWHTWATFGWGAPLNLDVSGFTGASVVGAYQQESIAVLRQVGLPDGSYYTFDYSGAGQVNAIRRYTYDTVQRSYTSYVYDNANSDCPRITQAHLWASNWTGISGLPTEATTTFGVTGDGAHEMVAPDGTTYRDYYYQSGWQRGLIMQNEVWGKSDPANSSSPVIRQKWTTTHWTQDNEAVSYQTNPRAWQTNIYDAGGNRRCLVTAFQGPFSRPWFVVEFDPTVTNIIRRTYFEYVNDAAYTNQRIIGLLYRQTVYDDAWAPVSRTSYGYDDPNRIQAQATYAAMHDDTYNQNFLIRGNLTSVSRWDATDIDNSAKTLTTQMTYDSAGNLVSTTDPMTHQTSIGFTDAFSDDLTRNTYAYPTTISDADGFSSYVKYNYDYGLKTSVQTPQPNTVNNAAGPIQTFEYDYALRLTRTTNLSNNAYRKYVYGPTYWQSWSSVNNLTDEDYSMTLLDGLGRTVGVAHEHPGSAGNYAAQLTVYDALGRVKKQSNPTEINGAWTAYGEDAAGWVYTEQTYDWKGRALSTTNTDGTQKYASYTGCGCAGGEAVTLTDEAGRQQKVYADFLGRQWKTEVLNWNGTVYSTTTNTFNALDQVTNVRQTDNATGVYQDTTIDYDGYGRLWKKHMPEQNAGTATVYAYNDDDTISSVTDARGASATYGYNNNRHLVTSIAYSAPSGVANAQNASFSYDSAGNRTLMIDGLGTRAYSFDQLSRLVSETRSFNGVGTFTLSYDYNLADELKKITDASNSTINYGYDSIGRLNGVTGS